MHLLFKLYYSALRGEGMPAIVILKIFTKSLVSGFSLTELKSKL